MVNLRQAQTSSAHGTSIRFRGRAIPVVLPAWNDPRLRLAAVIVSLQILGQTVLHFKLSIAQILVSVLVCALVEVVVTYRQQRVLVWPASAILTGNSTAFILRANGTQPGDWWSLNGIQYFILAALVGILSKYVIRVGGRHLYNPSNLGLVACLLAIGPTQVFAQYLWWGPGSASVVLALAVILVGGVWVLRPLQMLPMVAAFLVTFAVVTAGLAAAGRCFFAVWQAGPVCGPAYWWNLCTSPELLVFVFFMISDPRTAPTRPDSRLLYGMAIALVAGGLILFQPTEFGVKVALLASLTVVCAFVPLMDRFGVRVPPSGRRPATAQAILSIPVAAAIALAVPVTVTALAQNPVAIAIDGGPTLTSPDRSGSLVSPDRGTGPSARPTSRYRQ